MIRATKAGYGGEEDGWSNDRKLMGCRVKLVNHSRQERVQLPRELAELDSQGLVGIQRKAGLRLPD